MSLSLRRAALTLYALSDVDRKWVLQRLTSEQREALTPLLDDLLHLGIPTDPEIVQTVLRDAQDRPSADPDDRVQALWHSDENRIVALLRPEPDEFVARLLALRDWPWTKTVLDRLGNSRARSIATLKEGLSAMPTLLAEAVLRAASDRLAIDISVPQIAASRRPRERLGFLRKLP